MKCIFSAFFLTICVLSISKIAFADADPELDSAFFRQQFVDYVLHRMNDSHRPCDDFYDFVCGGYNDTASGSLFQTEAFSSAIVDIIDHGTNSVIDFITEQSAQGTLDRWETENHFMVGKALVDYIDDCARFAVNDTERNATIDRYLSSFQLDHSKLLTSSTIMNAFVRLILQWSIVDSEIRYDDENNVNKPLYLHLFSVDVATETVSFLEMHSKASCDWYSSKKFKEKLDTIWNTTATTATGIIGSHFPHENNADTDFLRDVEAFKELILATMAGNCTAEPLKAVNIDELENDDFRTALKEHLPWFMDKENITYNYIKIRVNESAIEQLHKQMSLKLDAARHVILVLAVAQMPSISQAVEQTYTKAASVECRENAMNSLERGGAIFRLFMHDYAIRHHEPMTTIAELLAVRELVEGLRAEMRKAVAAAKWLKDSRDALLVIDLLMAIRNVIGLPEFMFGDELQKELSRFRSFKPSESDLLQKILTLRRSNARLARRQLLLDPADLVFNARANSIGRYKTGELSATLMFLLPPMYSIYYPDSVQLGATGVVLAHELFHHLTLSGHDFEIPNRLLAQHEQFRLTRDCYKNFYGKKLCFSLTFNSSKVCDNGTAHWTENIVDVEGARMAYALLKKKMHDNLQQRPLSPALNYTDEQLFFITLGRQLCNNNPAEDEPANFQWGLLQGDDPHAPNKARLIGIAKQMKNQFAAAFSCKPTDPMVIGVGDEDVCQFLPAQ